MAYLTPLGDGIAWNTDTLVSTGKGAVAQPERKAAIKTDKAAIAFRMTSFPGLFECVI
jgi:hypothetical protein